ncbi:excalibur calcium-binding domain-containing protein [Streptomyces collinus]|uniref:excalibur calcium-binding domain-containing protein n=1 Tax=Streptomyces collinus TaxID=42684 RepID=UPI00369F4A9C
MSNPYSGPHNSPYPAPPTPQPGRPAPRWARKRYVLPALGLALFLGAAIGAGGEETTPDAKPASAKPQPTVTVTATTTATATPLAEEPEPAPTVTATKTVRVTTTVTAQPAGSGGSDDGGSGDSGSSQNVYYGNCSEVRAAGAAPIHRGEPGYASHLDRDNDGVACDI